VRLTSLQGEIVWSEKTGVWGEKGEVYADRISNPLRFQGQYFDAETGLHYNRHRYYDPEIAGFISQDPIGLAGGLNVYQYAPNPLGWVDPWGLSCSSDARALRANMVAAGKSEPSFKNSAHHIVMSNSKDQRMVALQNQMSKLGIDINTAENGIFLPSNSKVIVPAGNKLPNHASIHTNAYKQKVYDRLSIKNNSGDFISELNRINTEIANGTF
ncbi:RHS repeat-associated core domain-containing protein, partial [Klebsiella aerogenes]